MEPVALRRVLAATAARCYRSAGRYAYHFARRKFAGDPVFTALLARALVPDRARILDLGCGQGLLAAWLAAAAQCHAAADWYAGWPAPPVAWSFRGIELARSDVARAHAAHAALGASVQVEEGDIRRAQFGAADTIVLIDVLHYMDQASQEHVLGRARTALSPAGVLLMRIGDAGAGLPFRFGRWVDRTVRFMRGHGAAPLCCRPLGEWLALLERLGLTTDAIPMSAGTPFANVLLVARPR